MISFAPTASAQVILEIAQKHHVEPAAVVLRWLRQHN
eukprot:COSAG02_NODE_25383_length_660_cov_1.046346_1_plen_36_part_10